MTSKVSIISQTLNLLGLAPINDISAFPGSNPSYVAANTWYETILLGLLSEPQPWRFAMVSRKLGVLTESPPDDRWTYMLQIPTNPNYIVNYIVHDGKGYNIAYDIYEDKVLSNEKVVWMDYVFKPDPDKFPAYFKILLIFELAVVLAMPVTQEIEIAKTWASAARTQKLTARAADSVQTPSRKMPVGPLFMAHFGNNGMSIRIDGT
jgi:hypothetical protein